MQEQYMNLAVDHTAFDIDQQVKMLYLAAQRGGRGKRWWQVFRRETPPLLDLVSAERKVQVRVRRYAGLRNVPLRQIRGSEGRQGDFDADFRPHGRGTATRWLSVARAWHLGLTLPAVELILLGDNYYVRDGHHRISVAAAHQQVAIEARITVWEIEGPSAIAGAQKTMPVLSCAAESSNSTAVCGNAA
jgi:hypothetical protein